MNSPYLGAVLLSGNVVPRVSAATKLNTEYFQKGSIASMEPFLFLEVV